MKEKNKQTKHIPVLLKESINSLDVKPGGTYIDATLGGAGHTNEILNRMKDEGTLIVFDQDQKAVKRFEADLKLNNYKNSSDTKWEKGKQTVFVINKNFSKIDEVVVEVDVEKVDGVLADIGMSSDQLSDNKKGFSFLEDGELDMRMNEDLQVKASDLLNVLYVGELEKLFKNLSDISFAKDLAKEVVKQREIQPFELTSDLRNLVQKIVPFHVRTGANKNPEAKVFQALRIAVNDELSSLRSFLPLAFETLNLRGRLSIITFHSGEDRIVKNIFRDLVNNGKAKYVHKFIRPSEEELRKNTKSRSSKLRAIEKVI